MDTELMRNVTTELERRGLKPKGHELRGPSPLRADSDGDNFTFNVGGDKPGCWFDHKESRGGGLKELAVILGIPIPETEADTRPIGPPKTYRDLHEYATAHGVEAQVFIDAGWSVQPVLHGGRLALEYPTKNGLHLRFVDGAKPKYKPAKMGYRACWYRLEEAIEMARKVGHTFIVITNGAPSVVVAQSFGIPTAAVVGGEKKLADDLLNELKEQWQGEIIIALDCDTPGRNAAKAIEGQLIGLPVGIFNLNLGNGGEDLADFCKLYQLDAYSEFYKRLPKREAKSQVEILTAQALQDLAASNKLLTTAMKADIETRKQMNIEAIVATARANVERLELQSAKAVVTPAKSIVARNRERLAQARQNQQRIIGLRTGIPTLDYHTRGLLPGTVNLIIGATNMGKSTLAASITATLMEQGAGMVVPTESQPERWLNKLVAASVLVPFDKIEAGELTNEELAKVNQAYDRIDSRVAMDFLEGARPTPSVIESATLDAIARMNIKWLLLDSGSNLAYPGALDIYGRTVGVSNFVQGLALKTKLVIIMTWQANRATSKRGDGDKLVRLDDAQGGEVVGQDVDRAFTIYNHQFYVDQGSEKPNDSFPPGTSLVKCIKDRWFAARGATVMLKHVNDAGLRELDRRPQTAQGAAL